MPTEKRKINTLGFFDEVSVHSLAALEIFGSKIVALLTRAAARDLYDINNMIFSGLFDESQWLMLKKCAVFYGAIANKMPLLRFELDKIDSFTNQKIKTDLLPVIRREEHFDLQSVQKRVKDFLSDSLHLEERDIDFLRTFARKEYRPDLLFDDREIIKRIQNHPMVLWKMRKSIEEKSQ